MRVTFACETGYNPAKGLFRLLFHRVMVNLALRGYCDSYCFRQELMLSELPDAVFVRTVEPLLSMQQRGKREA